MSRRLLEGRVDLSQAAEETIHTSHTSGLCNPLNFLKNVLKQAFNEAQRNHLPLSPKCLPHQAEAPSVRGRGLGDESPESSSHRSASDGWFGHLLFEGWSKRAAGLALRLDFRSLKKWKLRMVRCLRCSLRKQGFDPDPYQIYKSVCLGSVGFCNVSYSQVVTQTVLFSCEPPLDLMVLFLIMFERTIVTKMTGKVVPPDSVPCNCRSCQPPRSMKAWRLAIALSTRPLTMTLGICNSLLRWSPNSFFLRRSWWSCWFWGSILFP